jgi:hypothetical protein
VVTLCTFPFVFFLCCFPSLILLFPSKDTCKPH